MSVTPHYNIQFLKYSIFSQNIKFLGTFFKIVRKLYKKSIQKSVVSGYDEIPVYRGYSVIRSDFSVAFTEFSGITTDILASKHFSRIGSEYTNGVSVLLEANILMEHLFFIRFIFFRSGQRSRRRFLAKNGEIFPVITFLAATPVVPAQQGLSTCVN